jgi:glutathione S-transferase
VTDAGFAATRRDYFASLPPVLRTILPLTLRPRMRRYLHGQGLGRHPADVIAAKAAADLKAVAALLGESPYMLGEPSSVDATAYGFLAANLSHPFPSAMREALCGQPNLVAYVTRMRERYWAA